MRIKLLLVPYDAGREYERLGLGPGHLVENGLPELLRSLGHEVSVDTIRVASDFATEVATTFRLCRRLAAHVKDARSGGATPLILSGNCFPAVGTLAGLGVEGTGVIWCDAHGEYNTPETTISGYLDGMGLATITGECWRAMAEGVPGFEPIPHGRVVHIGGHAFDPEERGRLSLAGVHLVPPVRIGEVGVDAALSSAIDRLRSSVSRAYLHLDLDVLDIGDAVACPFARAGGLDLGQVAESIRFIHKRIDLAGIGLAGYSPDLDGEGRTLRAALVLLGAAFDRRNGTGRN
jgi:arginase